MAELDVRRKRLLNEMGVTVWRLPPSSAGTGQAWARLEREIVGCQACELHQGRTHAVPGTGDRQARLLIVGEAPGKTEDARGEPFVGRSGQLLDAMLLAIGLDREHDVFITNVAKCHPPGDRDPRRGEVQACQSWLEAQVRLIEPECILAVGKVSAETLTGTRDGLGQLRGQWMTWGEAMIPLRVTYHPAYLLRYPGEKAAAWEDLLAVKRALEETAA